MTFIGLPGLTMEKLFGNMSLAPKPKSMRQVMADLERLTAEEKSKKVGGK